MRNVVGLRFQISVFASDDYLPAVQSLESQLADLPALNQVTVPDLWQQQAVGALREVRHGDLIQRRQLGKPEVE